mmetsp:Transcript_49257/g.117413  ORF Transcript_49257/g.117413 Transcript_49257/m.117413 type:complete len:231 (+) Transcript_49257:2504-3196(+)
MRPVRVSGSTHLPSMGLLRHMQCFSNHCHLLVGIQFCRVLRPVPGSSSLPQPHGLNAVHPPLGIALFKRTPEVLHSLRHQVLRLLHIGEGKAPVLASLTAGAKLFELSVCAVGTESLSEQAHAFEGEHGTSQLGRSNGIRSSATQRSKNFFWSQFKSLVEVMRCQSLALLLLHGAREDVNLQLAGHAVESPLLGDGAAGCFRHLGCNVGTQSDVQRSVSALFGLCDVILG